VSSLASLAGAAGTLVQDPSLIVLCSSVVN